MWSKPLIASSRRAKSGAVLLEVLLAVTVFSLAVVGMATTLERMAEVSNTYARDALVQKGLESIIKEAKQRPLSEMATSYTDPGLGVTYHTEVEALNISDGDGNQLEDLYTLRAIATYPPEWGYENGSDSVEIYIYKPEDGGN